MDPMLEAFITESRDNLETAGRCFLEMEKTPDDESLMNDLFRTMHTLKGSSGLFDIPAFTQVVHAAEDVLDTVRGGDLSLTSEHIDLFLDTLDQVGAWVDDLESLGKLGDGAEASGKVLSTNLRALIGEPKGESLDPKDDILAGWCGDLLANSGNSVSAKNYRNELPEWYEDIPNTVRDEAHNRVESEQASLICIEYQPDNQCFFQGDDPLHTVLGLPGRIWFDANNMTAWPELAEMDPFNCNLIFRVVAVGDENELQHYLRYIPEQITLTVHELPTADDSSASLPDTQHEEQTDEVSTEVSEAKLAAASMALATQEQILSMPCSPELFTGRVVSVAKVIENLIPVVDGSTQELDEAKQNCLTSETFEPMLSYLSNLKSSPQTEEAEKETVIEVSPPVLEKRPVEERPQPSASDTSVVNTPTTAVKTTLKVDQTRLDALMDLVGELVVAKNTLPFLAKRAEDEFGVRPLAKEIQSQYGVINRLSEELQSAMMQIRMVPVSTVFQRFPRLVRDLSRKLDKNIQLVMEGEDTEADKNVVESLADPLIHLVRNSLDHGLESQDDRLAAGKSAQGNITLRAIPHDDQVVLEVIDDGKGIDPNIIKRKAYEKGVIDEQRLDAINDYEALQLIFAAGFSTAEEISDLSGRGVGMDVVRTAVMDAGGKVSVDSVLGEGSTVRLSLPLSMAVSRVMMIEVADQTYGVSMENIVETVRIPLDSLQRIKHDEAVVLRNRLIPLFHLRKLLSLEPVEVLPEEVAVLVIMLGDQEVGLVIDDFHEGIDILQKPLEGVMANYPYYSGSALLGDGRVLLVLNTGELLACR